MPVLTIEEPTGGPDPTTISINPDLSGPGLPLECTFLWTPPPDVTPEAIADTIIAVLNAVRPVAAPHGPSDEDASRPMTTAPAAAGQPGRDDLTERIFRALYQEFDLRTINGTYVVVPKGTPWFAGTSLGDIARQISALRRDFGWNRVRAAGSESGDGFLYALRRDFGWNPRSRPQLMRTYG